MRSHWIEHKGRKIFYQDFSQNFHNSEAVRAELDEVQGIVKAEPPDSVLVLADMRETRVDIHLIPYLNAASRATKTHVLRTAVLGVKGVKRTLADLVSTATGQPLKYFEDVEEAKNWLVEE